MNAEQFTALSTLLRLRPGPAREAARLVLIEGMRAIDAARITGVRPAGVSNALTRVRRGEALAWKAVNG